MWIFPSDVKGGYLTDNCDYPTNIKKIEGMCVDESFYSKGEAGQEGP